MKFELLHKSFLNSKSAQNKLDMYFWNMKVQKFGTNNSKMK